MDVNIKRLARVGAQQELVRINAERAQIETFLGAVNELPKLVKDGRNSRARRAQQAMRMRTYWRKRKAAERMKEADRKAKVLKNRTNKRVG